MTYPRFYIRILNKKGGVVKRTARHGKRGILALIRGFHARIGDKYWIRVVYGRGELGNPLIEGRGELIDNEGTYDTKKEAIEAYGVLTDQIEIDNTVRLFNIKNG